MPTVRTKDFRVRWRSMTGILAALQQARPRASSVAKSGFVFRPEAPLISMGSLNAPPRRAPMAWLAWLIAACLIGPWATAPAAGGPRSARQRQPAGGCPYRRVEGPSQGEPLWRSPVAGAPAADGQLATHDAAACAGRCRAGLPVQRAGLRQRLRAVSRLQDLRVLQPGAARRDPGAGRDGRAPARRALFGPARRLERSGGAELLHHAQHAGEPAYRQPAGYCAVAAGADGPAWADRAQRRTLRTVALLRGERYGGQARLRAKRYGGQARLRAERYDGQARDGRQQRSSLRRPAAPADAGAEDRIRRPQQDPPHAAVPV